MLDTLQQQPRGKKGESCQARFFLLVFPEILLSSLSHLFYQLSHITPLKTLYEKSNKERTRSGTHKIVTFVSSRGERRLQVQWHSNQVLNPFWARKRRVKHLPNYFNIEQQFRNYFNHVNVNKHHCEYGTKSIMLANRNRNSLKLSDDQKQDLKDNFKSVSFMLFSTFIRPSTGHTTTWPPTSRKERCPCSWISLSLNIPGNKYII